MCQCGDWYFVLQNKELKGGCKNSAVKMAVIF